LRPARFDRNPAGVAGDENKETDDVSGPSRAAQAGSGARSTEETQNPADGTDDDSDSAPEQSIEDIEIADAPPQVAELALACARFVDSRYGIALDFEPDTLSFLDQWVRDARGEMERRPEIVEIVQSSAGAYLGEVIRREFGGEWIAQGTSDAWRLCLSAVYCAFNPIGMVREALLLEPAYGWHAHFDLDPGERESMEQRLAALPEVSADDYYAPSTRYDVVQILFEALRANMESQGLADVHFDASDYT